MILSKVESIGALVGQQLLNFTRKICSNSLKATLVQIFSYRNVEKQLLTKHVANYSLSLFSIYSIKDMRDTFDLCWRSRVLLYGGTLILLPMALHLVGAGRIHAYSITLL
jgi:hypothetical protein